MNDYLNERIKELRQLYKDTGEAQWRYRYQEVLRIKEWHDVLTCTQSARQSEGGSELPWRDSEQST